MTQPTPPAQTQEKEKLRQVIDASVHEISELKSEESFLVRYFREDEEKTDTSETCRKRRPSSGQSLSHERAESVFHERLFQKLF